MATVTNTNQTDKAKNHKALWIIVALVIVAGLAYAMYSNRSGYNQMNNSYTTGTGTTGTTGTSAGTR